ncbi:MAG: hypothetical protein K9H64_13110 [Bacteroidales bacterium]|nr:hypothetical protein [Bacteroidales bacterium]MCF8456588.1 hypothetical protein [Bacteroidales bacterium]
MKKTGLIFLILIIATQSIGYGQNHKIRTFYNSDSSSVKEEYYTLRSDTSIKDSLYLFYSEEGKLLKKGSYSKGEKIGNWLRFYPNRQVESFGYYDNNNQFTGSRLFYDTLGKIEQIDYYKEGIAYIDSLELQQEFISNSSDALRDARFNEYILLQAKYAIFQQQLAHYDSIVEQPEKLHFGDRIICDAYFYMGWFQDLKDERDSLLQLKMQLENLPVELDPSFFDLQVNPIKTQTDSLLASDSISYVLNRGPLLRKEYKRKVALLRKLETTNARIVKSQNKLEIEFKEKLPVFYQSEIEKLDRIQNEFKSEENLQTKIRLGNELEQLISDIEKRFKTLLELHKSIDEKKKKLKSYKEKYPVVYKNEEQAIQKEYESFVASTQLQKKIDLGNLVFKHIATSLYNFFCVDSMEILINEQFMPLYESYLKSYPRIQAKELKPISASIAGFNRMNNLEQKKQTGQDILDTIHYFSLSYNRFLEIDTVLDVRFKLVQARFKENYRAIYKSEVSLLAPQIKKYRDNGLSKSKLDDGNEVLDKITKLEEYYADIEAQRKEINTQFPLISEKYEKHFPPIYKNTIRLYEVKKENYENTATCKTYLEKGEEFLLEIHVLEEKYDEIRLQNTEIESNLNDVESLYQFDFPEVFNKEVKEEKSKIKEYVNEGFIEKKLQSGEFILAKLNTMQGAYPQLKEENSKIESEFSGLVKDYKENYYPLYVAHIKPLVDDEKMYRQLGYHGPKLMISNQIIQKIDEYKIKIDIFNEQSQTLILKHNEFDYNYKDRDLVKRMYKKGKWAYDELKNAYDNETDFDKKEELGKKIELMLTQFISLAAKDNTIINDEIRKAKTVDDVLKVIGIQSTVESKQ